MPAPANFGGGTRVERRDLEQVHIALALEGVPQGDPSLHSLQVFNSVLGGGMSSRLFQEVREQRGLCYAIYSFHMPYFDTGVFELYAGTDQADVPELMQVMIDAIACATENLHGGRGRPRQGADEGRPADGLESSGARAEQLARQMLAYGRPIPLDEIVAKVDAVTVESARAAGRDLLGGSRPALAVLGPGNGLERAAVIAESLARRAA